MVNFLSKLALAEEWIPGKASMNKMKTTCFLKMLSFVLFQIALETIWDQNDNIEKYNR